MRRREVIAGLALGAAMAPARAQVPGRVYRLGALQVAPRLMINHVLDAVRTYGFDEGRNLVVDSDGFALRIDDLDRHARDLTRQGVDAILANGDEPIAAGLRATRTIPILAVAGDLVASGFAASLARPGNNLTGISLLSPELDGKRLDLFIEMLPNARRIVALVDLATTPPDRIAALQSLAHGRGAELAIESIRSSADLAAAFERMRREGAAGAIVMSSAMLFGLRRQAVELEAEFRVPVMHEWPATAREGGLVGYNTDLPKLYRSVLAPTLARLLKGEAPAQIPIQQPTNFELVVNLRTAMALGLEIPPAFLARADEVIE